MSRSSRAARCAPHLDRETPLSCICRTPLHADSAESMGSLYAAAHKFASWFAAAHESVLMCAAARKVAERGKEGQVLDSLRGVYYREGRESSREKRGEKRRGEDGGGRQA